VYVCGEGEVRKVEEGEGKRKTTTPNNKTPTTGRACVPTPAKSSGGRKQKMYGAWAIFEWMPSTEEPHTIFMLQQP
jgi:hypothetical protein